jgi:hypothetical protein
VTMSTKCCVIDFCPKSCPPKVLALQEKILYEAQLKHPEHQWEPIWPLPDVPAIVSFELGILRLIDLTSQSQRRPGNKTVNVNVVSGWRVESISRPHYSSPQGMDDIMKRSVVERHRQRESSTSSRSNIIQFKRRKALDAENSARHAAYNYLKEGILEMSPTCRVSLFDNVETNVFMVLCKPEQEKNEATGKKPLVLLFATTSGKSLENAITPDLEFLVSLASNFGWKCENIALRNWDSRTEIQESLELVRRWCTVADGKRGD